jgi:uncharacterized integral membrane protein
MWFIRWLITLLLMIYAVIFAALNLEQVSLRIPAIPVYHTGPISMAVVVLLAVALGIVLWAIVAFFGSLDFRRRIHHLERVNRDLKQELTSLRNKAILDDGVLEGDAPPAAKPARAGKLNLPPYDYELDDEAMAQARNPER